MILLMGNDKVANHLSSSVNNWHVRVCWNRWVIWRTCYWRGPMYVFHIMLVEQKDDC